MRSKDLLRHLYTAVALIGLLAGRGHTLDAKGEERYIRQAKRIGRQMVEDDDQQQTVS